MNYRIVLKGHLSNTMEHYFEPMHTSKSENGYTTLLGSIPDQAVLFGILGKIRDLNIELVEVQQITNIG